MDESWIQIISLFIANAGLILWFRSESRSDHRQCIDLIVAIQQEMKEFHGRLEKQDAEFKAHIMYCHTSEKKQ